MDAGQQETSGLAAGVPGDGDLIAGSFAQKTVPFEYWTVKRGNARGFRTAPGMYRKVRNTSRSAFPCMPVLA
jgi:hypothetical protein